MEEFSDILRQLKEFRNKEKLNTDDNVLFDGAVRIYNSHFINRQLVKQKKITDTLMTAKQQQLLKNLGYTGSTNLTKKQATDLIDQYLTQRKNRNVKNL